MKSSQVQATIAARLAAVPSIAAFAPFIIESDTTDNESVVDAALEARGACIAIDEVEGAESDSAASSTRSLAKSQISVVIYEQPNVAHTPARLELIEAVIDAIIGGNFQLIGFSRFRREKGGVACVADFSAQVIFG